MLNVKVSAEKNFSISRSEFEAFCHQMGHIVPRNFDEFSQNLDLYSAFKGFASMRLREAFLEVEVERFNLENYPDR